MVINNVKEIADYYQDYIDIVMDLGEKLVKNSDNLVKPNQDSNYDF